MKIWETLAKPVWRHLVHSPGFEGLGAEAIQVTDCFFDFLLAQQIMAPSGRDVVQWLVETRSIDTSHDIDLLEEVLAVCQPSFLAEIRAARALAKGPKEALGQADSLEVSALASAVPSAPADHVSVDWDPIARPPRKPPIPRHVSVAPWQLPSAYQTALRRAADGLPGAKVGMRVPSRSMVLRMREKLCQYAWTTAERRADPRLGLAGVDLYFGELKARLVKKHHGVRWATLRATADALLLFCRYSGLPDELAMHLASYRREYEARELGQRALKFYGLAKTGNSTTRILEMADTLLAGVAAEDQAARRHRMRNAAAILSVFGNAALRNASAYLVFGESLFWEAGEWVIRTRIQKTHVRRPEIFEFPLHPLAGRFIDAVLQGDASPALLPKLREQALACKRPLFVLSDGAPAAHSYVPRVFRALTGNSFTTLRVMLYSDAVAAHGVEGIELAKPSAHHASTEVVKQHYIAEQVAEVHATNLRQRRQRRQGSLISAQQGLLSALDDASAI
ncbi:hypothetical protein AYJ57_15205 [Salipiger sp. CCB-MM3]|uniref:hypothetical protein n=1 Tax=Salipiger sp. CCB-MM3 TaxID=1792508 RepID=UPI00080A9CF5|nr:hypothetical protein [Salipiger sp. CCB-MM3]ANT61814.1 hypothetical protein AYJ57_15205 [Salipiger sp. CCB-MM3]